MALKPGSRVGPYEVVSLAGAGGMGEVYRARDTRLDRTVAIKVLPAGLSQRAEHRERFEREARAVSALNHPHICTLHDIGRHEGVDFLVMEHLEGETLAARLARGELPLDQALRCAVEIASALDAAHRRGIIHRDLKPGNVMLTKAGVKLLDFGLAKWSARPTSSESAGSAGAGAGAAGGVGAAGSGRGALDGEELPVSQIPTLSRPLTAEGTLLGTLQYMAPEQLEGKEADARTDIFAFGVVLYEMLTGKRAFEGKSQASLIAAILEREPAPPSALQPMSPPALDRLVKRCIAKDPDDRWQSARDLEAELRWISEVQAGRASDPGAAGIQAGEGTGGGRGQTSGWLSRRERLAWGMALVCAAAVAVAALMIPPHRPDSTPRPVIHSSIQLPENLHLSPGARQIAISPDGRRLAFQAFDTEARVSLWVRDLDSPALHPLPDTNNAVMPFWSPDSRWLAFFSGGRLRKIDVTGGGRPETVCDAGLSLGGAWGLGGDILITGLTMGGVGSPILRVSALGGAPKPATTLDAAAGETLHGWPSFLPDGNRFLYMARGESGNGAIFAGSLDGSVARQVVAADTDSGGVYTSSGHLLFYREGSLRAQRFDAGSLKPSGETNTVPGNILFEVDFGFPLFSVSGTGLLAYPEGIQIGASQMTWVDRTGKPIGVVGNPGNYYHPRLSHDGRRLAVDLSDSHDLGDIWILDTDTAGSSRFTFHPANDSAPVWSPDDRRLVFITQRDGRFGDLFQKAVEGAGDEESLLESSYIKRPSDWSADGRFIAFSSGRANLQREADIWILSLADGKASPLLATPSLEVDAHFSPDGRWLAYASDEAGSFEVYVQPFPGPGRKWQISREGGSMPAWRGDGREIYYLSVDNKMMAVPVSTARGFEAGTPRALFPARLRINPLRQYDVTPDGQRFILNAALREEGSSSITLVVNWDAGLPK